MPASRTGVVDAATALRAIWAEVLERTDIGPDDDFFRIGGHSLRALKVAAGIRRTFGVKVQLLDVYENRTMRAQLALLEQPGATTAS
jgi:aryl carrier-like protein